MPDNAPSIVFVLPGVDCGGSEHVVGTLANTFVEQGCTISLVAFVPDSTKPFYSLDHRVQFKPIAFPPGGSGRFRFFYAMRRAHRLRKCLKQIRPDLVVSFLTRTNILTLLSRPDCPVIISERNNAGRQPLGHAWSLLRKIMYPRAAALVTMTAGAMKQLEKFAPAIRRVIPNHAATFRNPESPGHGTSLVAVGRLVPQKGFDLLLQAFATAAKQHPDWTLTIWGEGEQRTNLERQRDALGMNSVVRLPGVSKTPGSWTYNADVFVLSSRYEGWGLVVGEAMSAGIATVAFDCEFGPSEMITHNKTGVLVPPENVAALADALGRLMSDAVLRQRLATAGQRAMRRFTTERVTQLWAELLGEFVRFPPERECRDAA
jgi:glycosyltransferase involved in cell wall biosynthesis